MNDCQRFTFLSIFLGIRSINLSNTDLKDHFESLIFFLKSLPELAELDLSYWNNSPQMIVSAIEGLSQSTSLKTLKMVEEYEGSSSTKLDDLIAHQKDMQTSLMGNLSIVSLDIQEGKIDSLSRRFLILALDNTSQRNNFPKVYEEIKINKS